MNHATDKDFAEKVLKSKTPVLVDFHATWCGPCKQLSPLLDDLEKEYKGKIEFCKVDIDQAPNTATQYGIQSVPTMIIFKGGQVSDMRSGLIQKSMLKEWFKHILEP